MVFTRQAAAMKTAAAPMIKAAPIALRRDDAAPEPQPGRLLDNEVLSRLQSPRGSRIEYKSYADEKLRQMPRQQPKRA